MPKLSIIILSYNTKDLTISCINSIINLYKKEFNDGKFEIILVDNASSDETVKKVKEHWQNFKQIRVVENKQNFGFSKGNNLGAKKAKGDVLFFLNSDTEIKDSGLLKMIEYLEKHQEVGVLGGKLINIDGTIQRSAGKFFNLWNVFLMLMGMERFGLLRFAKRQESYVDWVSGACMMIKKTLFEKIKGFDEYFFMYVEDLELCFRIKKYGYKTSFYPDIKILHKELGSSNRSFAIINIYKGLLYFYKKHKSKLEYNLIKILLMAKALILIFLGNLTRNNYLSGTYKKAYKAL